MSTNAPPIDWNVKRQIDLWVQQAVWPSDFVEAVLANDLMEAFGRADEYNIASMFSIVQYVYSHTPLACHGSIEKMEKWQREHSVGEA